MVTGFIAIFNSTNLMNADPLTVLTSSSSSCFLLFLILSFYPSFIPLFLCFWPWLVMGSCSFWPGLCYESDVMAAVTGVLFSERVS